MHVLQRPIERDRVSLDGGNRAPLGLPRIEIRGREDDLVAGPPARSVQDLYGGAARRDGLCQPGPGVLPITVEVQGPAHDHDSAVTAIIGTHAGEIFAFDVVGESDGRLARVRSGFGANLQFAVQHDPLGAQLEVLVVGEGEFAVDRQATQRRRADVEEDVLARGNGDLVACDRYLAVWPGGGIRPARLFDGGRSSFLGLNDSECADQHECWKEQNEQE